MTKLTRAELNIASDLLTAWNGDWSTNQLEILRYPKDARNLVKVAQAVTQVDTQKLRSTVIDLAASLAAAISLLERKEAPSDKMLTDYRASLERARAALGFAP